MFTRVIVQGDIVLTNIVTLGYCVLKLSNLFIEQIIHFLGYIYTFVYVPMESSFEDTLA